MTLLLPFTGLHIVCLCSAASLASEAPEAGFESSDCAAFCAPLQSQDICVLLPAPDESSIFVVTGVATLEDDLKLEVPVGSERQRDTPPAPLDSVQSPLLPPPRQI